MCPLGTYGSLEGSVGQNTTCQACPPGTAGSSPGVAFCDVCLPGSYSAIDLNVSLCKPCPSGRASSFGASSCFDITGSTSSVSSFLYDGVRRILIVKETPTTPVLRKSLANRVAASSALQGILVATIVLFFATPYIAFLFLRYWRKNDEGDDAVESPVSPPQTRYAKASETLRKYLRMLDTTSSRDTSWLRADLTTGTRRDTDANNRCDTAFFSLCRRPCKPKHGIGWCDFFGLVRHSACTNYLYLHSGSPVLIMFVLYWRASIPSYAFIVIRARSLPSLTLLSSAPLCPFLATMRTFCRHGLRLRQQPPRPFLVSPKASPFA